MKSLLLPFVILYLFALTVYAQQSQLRLDRKKGRLGYVDQTGKVVIKHKYSSAENFSEELALVENDLKYGYINEKGDVSIELKYVDAGTFSEGVAYVAENGKYGYIDTSGRLVIESKFDYAEDFLGGYAFVRKLNPDTSLYGVSPYVMGIIDRKGNLVTDAWYSTIFRISADSFQLNLKGTVYILSKDGKLKKLGGKEKSESSISETFIVVEIPPEFVGGFNALVAYISANLKYPTTAKSYGIEGKVYVGFDIDEKGKVGQVSIIKGEYPILNKEAVRLVKSMPDWIPGTQNGTPVRIRYSLPLSFKLSY